MTLDWRRRVLAYDNRPALDPPIFLEQDLKKCDFKPIVDYLEAEKEKKKSLTKEVRLDHSAPLFTNARYARALDPKTPKERRDQAP